MIYCAFTLIDPLLIPHLKWSVGLCIWSGKSLAGAVVMCEFWRLVVALEIFVFPSGAQVVNKSIHQFIPRL
jgi:hypothetical protein